MSKNLKDLIEQAEDEEKTHAQLEKKIESLERKVAKLETKVKNKKNSSKIEGVKPKEEKPDSEEFVILKEFINSQKEELTQNQQEKEVLEQQVEKYKQELKNIEESQDNDIKDQIIMRTQNSLNNLIEDYGRLENTNKSLKEDISRAEKENLELLESSKKIETEGLSVEQIEVDLKSLKKQLNDLEREKKLLEEINSTFRTKEISVEDLEKTIEVLTSNNLEVKKENQKLTKIVDTRKAEISHLAKFEEKVSYLEAKIIGLQKENEHLMQKDAILLAKTINVMEQENREHITEATDLKTSEKNVEAKEEKVLEETLEVVQSAEPKSKIISDFIPIKNNDQLPITPEPEVLIEEVVSTNNIKEAGYRKKICPKCGNTNKAQIREIDDKTRMIYPGFYAKKYKCGQCATEWAK